jgi:hypothetical protein
MSYLTAAALDRWHYPPSTLAFAIGVAFTVPGLTWLLIQSWLQAAPVVTSLRTPVDDELAETRLG